jgi:Zn-finger nucleic acid-binding protein
MKRAIYRVRWSKAGVWKLVDASKAAISVDDHKRTLVTRARAYCRGIWVETGQITQLVIHNKNGQIQKGNSGEATYGRDPKRSKE